MTLRSRTPAPVVAVLSLVALAAASCSRQPAEQATSGGQAAAERRATPASSREELLKRGEYLVQTIGCGHCHTPGGLYGEPDPTRFLSGSEVGWKGRWGVSYPRNLTPDSATGIAMWSEEDIVKTIRTLKRPDGSVLHLPMPWNHFIYLTEDDARGIAAYLKTVAPIVHKVPDYVPPGGKATGVYIEFPPPPPWDQPRFR